MTTTMPADNHAVVVVSSSPPPPPPPAPAPPPRPKLLLDSGASAHTVGDARLLSDLRDAPRGLVSRSASNGSTMPVTKIGDIDIDIPGTRMGLRIPGVLLVPGLRTDGVISVRQLARECGIATLFVGHRAALYAGRHLVGVAAAPPASKAPWLDGRYVLEYLMTPTTKPGGAAAAASRGDSDGEVRLVPAPRPKPEPEPEQKRFAWRKFSPLRVRTRKQLRLRAHMS